LESYVKNGLLQDFTDLDKLVKQFESSEIYKDLGNLFDRWEIELRSRSLLSKSSESHKRVQNLLDVIIKIAKRVQDILEDFKRCGDLMRELDLYGSEENCRNLFSNLDKLQVQLFFITCRFVHIGSNINEEYHNPIVHKPNKVRTNSIKYKFY